MVSILLTKAVCDKTYLPLFNRLYETYCQEMYKAAFSYLNNPQDAEDAVQDAFFGVARNMHTVYKFENEAQRRSYLLKAARNAALSRVENQHREESIPYEDIYVVEGEDDTLWEELCATFFYEELVKAVSELSPTYRDVLEFHLQGIPTERIGEMFGLKRETAKRRISRGKALLREAMARKGWVEHG